MKIVLLLLLFTVTIGSYASYSKEQWKERPDLKKYFKEAGVEGSFLLYDLKQDKYLGYNLKRTKIGFIPASTYKIFNSLVALETGVIRDEKEILKWDGIERKISSWNQDQDLQSAIRNSTVWFYQELARRIGQERMQHYVDLAHYGNRNINGGIDRFWLDGDIRVTSEEQIDLLVKLHLNKLPFSARTVDIVKNILINEKTDRYTLRAKTGWSGVPDKKQTSPTPIGWWVGYVERKDNTYFFATNIDITKDEDAKARIPITKNILRDLAIIE
ncbi:MAG: class D beta-lactamase [Blastocatellia bacterium]|nr:class D beta-lactamase [Blastocatellia bacterium]